jgi:hypothetical protein
MDDDYLARMNDGEMRDRILSAFNQSTLDRVGPVDQGMAVLKDMNELGEDQEQIIRDGVPKISVV